MMADLHSLIAQEIPKGRQDLVDSHTNLERVAEYCEGNYFTSENRRGALEETKNFTTQSLASVAYQINTLAYNFIQMLDLQQQQIADMGSQITNIAQTVMVHKEKVARREIGVLTTNKSSTRQYKIVAPINPERPIKYVRKPIDFGALDDIGHGVRTVMAAGVATTLPGMQRPVRQNSTSSQGSSGGVPAAAAPGGGPGGAPTGAIYATGPAPTTKPPTPPQPARSASTLTRQNKEYRTPPAIAPPQVPSNYAANFPVGHPRRQEAAAGGGGGARGPGYSTLPRGQAPGAAAGSPQVGMVHPMHHEQPGGRPRLNSDNGHDGIYRYREAGDPGGYRAGLRLPSQSSMSTSAGGAGARGSTASQQSYGGALSSLPPHSAHSARSSASSLHSMSHSMPAPASPGAATDAATALGGAGAAYNMQPGAGMVGLSTLRLRNTVTNSMPPPPSPLSTQLSDSGRSVRSGTSSPPLPPPPPESQPGVTAAVAAAGHYRPGYQQQTSVLADDSLPGWVPKDYLEKVVAVYDYAADKEDELSFSENSVIYVLKRNDDGWWEGVMDGVTGLFPGNYVEPLMS